MASQKIRIKLMSYDTEMLDQAAARIVETMKKSGAKISGPIPLPTEKEIVTILRSPHKLCCLISVCLCFLQFFFL